MLALVKRVVAWLLTLLAGRVARTVAKANEQAKKDPKSMPSLSLNLPNVGPIPLSAFEELGKLFPVVIDGLKANKSAQDIVTDLEASAPAIALSVAENVINVVFPGAGTLIQVLTWMIENSKTQTQEEVNAWMARFGAGGDTAS